MRRSLLRISPLALAVVWAGCSDSPVEPATDPDAPVAEGLVAPPATDAASLQAALDAAAASGGSIIVQGEIVLSDPLTYVGDADLTIIGRQDARIVGPTNAIAPPSLSNQRVGEETVGDGLQVLGEPNLTIRNVHFEGQTGHGIYFELTDDASGTVEFDFSNVSFDGQGLAGMWVEDQTGGSQAAPDPIDSDASLHLKLRNVTVTNTGFAEDEAQSCRPLPEEAGCPWADFDGMRFNEGGLGDLTFDIVGAVFMGNAGDGIELDETGEGSAEGSVSRSAFDQNGFQPQFPADVEDGFDIDEVGPGQVSLTMDNVDVNDNVDEGIDLDENGSGDVLFKARNVVTTGNVDENIKITESEDDPTGAGDIILDLVDVTADGSLDSRGARFEEFGVGGVVGSIRSSTFSDNTEDDGLRIDEEGEGSGNDGQGLQVTENGIGDIAMSITASAFTGNGNTAVEMEEEDDGGHDVVIRASTLLGEGGEEALDVIEADGGSSTVSIRASTVDPAPVSSGDVTFDIRP
jgi:hypothetical protein